MEFEAGLNMPMLLEAIESRETCALQELKQICMKAAVEGVVSARELFFGCSEDSDPILKTLLEKTIPDEILLKIWSVDEGTNGIYEQEGTTLLLVPDVDTLFKLYENGIQLKRVSISRLPCEMGKEKIYDHVFVSGEERKKLGILLNHGIDLRIHIIHKKKLLLSAGNSKSNKEYPQQQ